MSAPVAGYNVGTYLLVTPLGTGFTFGKHRGTDIADVPIDYLRWCLREITDAPEEFGKIIRDELHRRKHAGVGSFDFEEDE